MKTDEQLRNEIQNLRDELKRRATCADPFIIIKGQETCKRALIVAAVQGHTVGVYGPHGHGKTMLADAGRAIGVFVVEEIPCPCGNYTDPRLPCKCDVDAITKHQKALSRSAGQCDIHVECPPVPTHELLSKRHGTAIASVRDQLDRAGSLPDKTTIGPGGEHIIRQAIPETGMSAQTLNTYLSVAQSIAALCQCDTINVEHLVEAVHYRPLDRLL